MNVLILKSVLKWSEQSEIQEQFDDSALLFGKCEEEMTKGNH